jgi:intein/homing endonuclease
MRRSDWQLPVITIDPTLVKSTAEHNRNEKSEIGEMFGFRTPKNRDVEPLKLPRFTPTQSLTENEFSKIDYLSSLESLTQPSSVMTDCVEIEKWFRKHVYKMERPMQYLGNEVNTMDPSLYEEADLRILICRLSSYDAVGGSLTHGALAQLLRHYAKQRGINVYIDMAFLPCNNSDAEYLRENKIPWAFGRSSKRHPRDFDVMLVSFALTMETWNIMPFLKYSGIPLFKDQRKNEQKIREHDYPLIIAGGVFSDGLEMIYGKFQEHECVVDATILGDGEVTLDETQKGLFDALKQGQTKKQFLRSMHQPDRVWWYEPDLYEHIWDESPDPKTGYPELRQIKLKDGIDYAKKPGELKRVYMDDLNKFPVFTDIPVHYDGTLGNSVDVQISSGCLCVAGDTVIETEFGFETIKEAFERLSEGENPIIQTRHGQYSAEKIVYAGKKKVRKFSFENDDELWKYEITCTDDHMLDVMECPDEKEPRWRRAGDIQIGEEVWVVARPDYDEARASAGRINTEAQFYFRKVVTAALKSVSDYTEVDCYDVVNVDEYNEYIANGIVTHNSGGLCSFCVAKGTKVSAQDYALVNIEDLSDDQEIETPYGPQVPEGIICQGEAPCITIKTKRGHTLTCTLDHKIMTYINNVIGMTQAGDLKVGQHVQISQYATKEDAKQVRPLRDFLFPEPKRGEPLPPGVLPFDERPKEEQELMKYLRKAGAFLDEIVSIEDAGKQEVWDIWDVAKGHMFYANGFIVSNCHEAHCTSASTMTETANGLVTIGELANHPEEYLDQSLQVVTDEGMRDAPQTYHHPRKAETLKIRTQKGFEFEGTLNHKLKDEFGDFRQLRSLKVGDYLRIQLGTIWPSQDPVIPKTFERGSRCRTDITIPETLTPEWAALLGWWTAEGSYSESQNTRQIQFTLHGEERPVVKALLDKLGLPWGERQEEDKDDTWTVYISSIELVRWFKDDLKLPGGAVNKVVPWPVLKGTRKINEAFLSTLTSGDGCPKKSSVFVNSTSSPTLARQVQQIWRRLGIPAAVNSYEDDRDPRELYEKGRKEIEAGEVLATERKLSTAYQVQTMKRWTPLILEWIDLIPSKRSRIEEAAAGLKKPTSIRDLTGASSKCRMVHWHPELAEMREGIIGTLLVKIESIERAEAEVFDIVVPSNHTYIANGFVSHNTQGRWREREFEKVTSGVEQAVRKQGAEDSGFYSLTWSLHSEVYSLLLWNYERFGSSSLISQRADQASADPNFFKFQNTQGMTSTTIGVEGCSQRMRNYFNKSLSTDQLYRSVENAARGGMTALKLFMILSGLETPEDIKEFCDTLKEIHKRGKRIAKELSAQGGVERQPIRMNPSFMLLLNMPHCVSTGTFIDSAQQGLKRIDDYCTHPEEYKEHKELLCTDGKPEYSSHTYNGGVQSAIHMKTSYGYELTATPNHRIRVITSRYRDKRWDPDGKYEWRRMDELEEGDSVVLQLGCNDWPQDRVVPNTYEGHAKITLPAILNEAWAELLGWWIAEGSFSGEENCRQVQWELHGEERFWVKELLISVGLDPKEREEQGHDDTWTVYVNSAHLAHWMGEDLGLQRGAVNKVTPRAILTGSKKINEAYMRGLLGGDGCTDESGGCGLRTSSPVLAEETQQILRRLNLIATRSVSRTAGKVKVIKTGLRAGTRIETKHDSWYVRILGQMAPESALRLKLRGEKGKRLSKPYKDVIGGTAVYVKPRKGIQKLQANTGHFIVKIKTLKSTTAHVMDFCVPTTETFIGNGFVCHNTSLQWAPCFLPTTRISIEDGGFKEISELKEGDKVITHRGRSRDVKEVMSRDYHGKIYKIRVAGLPRPFYTTPEHPIYGKQLLSDKRGGKNAKTYTDVKFLAAKNIRVGDEIHTPSLVMDTPEVDFSTEEGYVLGVFSAEGCIKGKENPKTEWKCGHRNLQTRYYEPGESGYYVCFHLNKEKDKSVFDRLVIFAQDRGIPWTIWDDSQKKHNLVLKSRKLANFCQNHVGTHATEKRLSKDLMGASAAVQKEFLIGSLLGDGSVFKRVGKKHGKNLSAFNTASDQMANQIFWMLDRQGVTPTLSNTKNSGGPTNRMKEDLRINKVSLNAYETAKFLGTEKPNKKKGGRYASAACSYGRVESVEEMDYRGKVYNLEVDEDHTYVAELSSVHNCAASLDLETDIARPIVETARECGFGFRTSLTRDRVRVSNWTAMIGREGTKMLLEAGLRCDFLYYGPVAKRLTWYLDQNFWRWGYGPSIPEEKKAAFEAHQYTVPVEIASKGWMYWFREKFWDTVFPWDGVDTAMRRDYLWNQWLNLRRFVGNAYCLKTSVNLNPRCHECGACDPCSPDGPTVGQAKKFMLTRKLEDSTMLIGKEAARKDMTVRDRVRFKVDIYDDHFRFAPKNILARYISRALFLSLEQKEYHHPMIKAFLKVEGHSLRWAEGQGGLPWVCGTVLFDHSFNRKWGRGELQEMIPSMNQILSRNGMKIVDTVVSDRLPEFGKNTYGLYTCTIPGLSLMDARENIGKLGLRGTYEHKKKVASGKGAFKILTEMRTRSDIMPMVMADLTEKGTKITYLASLETNPITSLGQAIGAKVGFIKPNPIWCLGYYKYDRSIMDDNSVSVEEGDIFAALEGQSLYCDLSGEPIETDIFTGELYRSQTAPNLCLAADLANLKAKQELGINTHQSLTK